jgi:hypothetical protein
MPPSCAAASQVYDTQTLLENETQQLRQELAEANKQIFAWSERVQRINSSLKHVGDVENYVSVLSKQGQVLTQAISRCKDLSAAGSGNSTGASLGAPLSTSEQPIRSSLPPVPQRQSSNINTSIPGSGTSSLKAEEEIPLPVSRRASR